MPVPSQDLPVDRSVRHLIVARPPPVTLPSSLARTLGFAAETIANSHETCLIIRDELQKIIRPKSITKALLISFVLRALLKDHY